MNTALGHVVASVPESTIMDVHNSVLAITGPGIHAYLKLLMNDADVEKVSWNNGLRLRAPGVLSLEALLAIDEMIVMGTQADPELLKVS